MSGLQLRGISKTYGELKAVDNFSLDIADGEFVALLGPSGCGKSTVLRIVAGLLDPSAGRIRVDGDDITATDARDRDLAMVFQSYALYPHLNVRANLAFGLESQGAGKDAVGARVDEVASQLDLSELMDRKPRELSGGQRQRVAVGRAIARRPRAFLMDEPLSNLDARLRTATRRELVRLHRSLKATIVYVTHDQVEAMTMATKIVVMNQGRIEQVGTPLEVYDRPATTFVASFIGAPPMNLIDANVRSIDGVVRAQAEGLDVALVPGDTSPRQVVLGVRPGDIEIVGQNTSSAVSPLASGVVDFVENLGSEEIVFVDIGQDTLAIRCERGTSLRESDAVQLGVKLSGLHLFDGETGQRLMWESTPSTATRVAPVKPRAEVRS